MRVLSIALLTVALLATSIPRALAAKPTQVEPTRKRGKERRAERRSRDMSRGGTEDGTFEFVLGGLTAAVTAVLIGRGIWELTQIDETRKACENGGTEAACLGDNPGRGNQIAAGLSFGFAVPLSVATGFLFSRAVRARRDHRAWHEQHPEVSLHPSVGPRGGGLALQLRF